MADGLMDQGLHMHMLPARDLAALRKFYVDGLGWSIWGSDTPGSLMLQAGTTAIAFLDRDYLAAESGIEVSATPRAINTVFVTEKADVDVQIAGAIAAGATLTSPVRNRDGGLNSGYFTDPEGNGWEIVWSPVMRPGVDGGLELKLP